MRGRATNPLPAATPLSAAERLNERSFGDRLKDLEALFARLTRKVNRMTSRSDSSSASSLSSSTLSGKKKRKTRRKLPSS